MIRWWRLLLPMIGMVAVTSPAQAHPHAWIDLRSQVLLDDEGRVRALELIWLFDDYYTVMVAEELGSSAPPTKEYLEGISKRNLTNLREYDYFTKITFNGEPQGIADVTRYDTEVYSGRLWMRFEVPLEQPIDPKAGEVAFSVYDPTYWIEILHLEAEPVVFSGAGAEGCLGKIIQPKPTFEQVALANALDTDETAGEGLGELFAEKVVVKCS